MPRTKRDEDLFNQQSSMSFLEHLDELRKCLIGSLMCVTIGVVVSMIPIGKLPSLTTMAVDYIQTPLKRSLESFHISQSQKQLQKKSAELRELGYDADIADAPAKLHMTARPFYIFPKDLDVLRAAGGDVLRFAGSQGFPDQIIHDDHTFRIITGARAGPPGLPCLGLHHIRTGLSCQRNPLSR